jgi:hypothetical protein
MLPLPIIEPLPIVRSSKTYLGNNMMNLKVKIMECNLSKELIFCIFDKKIQAKIK